MSAECKIYCRNKYGYDSGRYDKERCICEKYIEYKDLEEKTLILNTRKPKKQQFYLDE